MEMSARLKSYSCSNCGGVLNVDRDEDVFDCPFCGARFDVMDFHKKEILDEVDELWRRKDFAGAKNKLERTLPKDTDDFELLSAYALSVANLTSLDELEDLKNINLIQNAKLQKLLKEDARYSSGDGAPYFTKLAEILPIAYEHNELSGEKYKLQKTADDGKRRNAKEKIAKMAGSSLQWLFFAMLSFFLVSFVVVVVGPWAYMLFVASLFVAGIFDGKKIKKLNEEYQEKNIQFEEMEAQARALDAKMSPFEDSYKKEYKELQKLRPNANDKKQSPKEYKPQQDNAVLIPDSKNARCSKCGGEMVLDKSRKLFVCKFCGIAYGYSLFFGNLKQKAYELLKEADFAEADKRFIQILENDPDDLEAMRGRILCAGGWRAFSEIKITDKISEEKMNSLKDLIHEAKDHFPGTEQYYFDKIIMVLLNVKYYGETPEDGIAEDFNKSLRILLDADRDYRIKSAEK